MNFINSILQSNIKSQFQSLICSVTSSLIIMYGMNNKLECLKPFEAISSFAYAMIKTDFVSVKYSMFILSISSFNLWAASTDIYPNNPIIHLIDISSIWWVILVVTLQMLPNANHKRKVIIIVNCLVTMLLVSIIVTKKYNDVLQYYNINVIPITSLVYGMSSLVLNSYWISNKNYLNSLTIISLGFVSKLFTIYYDFELGTGIFHLMSAIGIHKMINSTEMIKTVLIEETKNQILIKK